MICCLTPTGGRPEGLELLARYISAQNYHQPIRWIIVDDCNPATPLPETYYAPFGPIEVEVIRPAWHWTDTSTQCKSMALALDQVADDDTVIIFEDDDAYLPDHIVDTVKALETFSLVGERFSRYYNVATRRWQLIPGKNHASLASNGVRGDALRLLRNICAVGTRTIDCDLWKQFRGPKHLTEHANVIGIKGMPGRGGIGIGHRNGFGRPDTEDILCQWLGDYAGAYDKFQRVI